MGPSDLTSRNEIVSANEVRDVLTKEMEDAIAEVESDASVPQVVRVELPVAYVDPLTWLRAQPHDAKVFWSERDDAWSAAGAGAAWTFRRPPGQHGYGVCREIAALLENSPENVRTYGGCCFNFATRLDNVWNSFGGAYFVLPRLELIQEDDTTRICCNAVLGPGDRGESTWEPLRDDIANLAMAPGELGEELPRVIAREEIPDRKAWGRAIAKALELFTANRLAKVVLARRLRATFDNEVDALALLQRLASMTTNSYHVAVQPSAEAAFVSASPERLYARQGRSIQSEALAGTRPRSTDDQDDDALARELRESEKDIREHGLVLDAIRRTFKRLCESVDDNDPVEVLKLRWVQHLHSDVRGELLEGVSDEHILPALHPTPAVGGHPTAEALRVIEELESFTRGWYAAPIGWLSRDAAEFAVAIRSALVRGNTVTLWTGAGIVPGSDADAEWAELDAKMTNFTNVLGAHDA